MNASDQSIEPGGSGRHIALAPERQERTFAGTPEWKRIGRALLKNRGAAVGLAIFSVLVASAMLASLVAPYPPNEQNLINALQSPSSTHLMGTDEFGRDILSRILHGSAISLRMGLLAVSLAGLVGVTLGLCAGYFGGALDAILMRLVDALLAFPDILLALVVLTILGPSISSVTIAVAVAQIPVFVRVARASSLTERELDYVVAGRVLGAPTSRILLLHLLPNIAAPLMVLASVSIGSSILVGAGLSFLGLGARPPSPEWGAMLISSRLYIYDAPWIALFPGAAIMLTVFAFNMMGDGLRDATDVRLRNR